MSTDRLSTPDPLVLWRPSDSRRRNARVTRFQDWLLVHRGLRFDHYEALWQWSVSEPTEFWSAIWEHFEIPAHRHYERVLSDDPMPHTRWFEGAQLNVVDLVFRHAGLTTPALVYDSEADGIGEVSWAQLQHDVAALAHTFKGLGVGPGDRVVGYLPNIAQTVVAFLATASLGAVWAVCAPDMGPVSVGDRFQQIEPTVLIACDGYRFGGKGFDRRAVLDEVLAGLPTLRALVWVPHLDPHAAPPAASAHLRIVGWQAATAHDVPLRPLPVASDHPLWILYSSGTTGLPKAIVHGHAGIAVNSQVLNALHGDLHAGERYFWTSSTSWMVWNAHVMGLMVGATLVLFDGSPMGTATEPDWGTLWRLAGRERISYFGAGAAFYAGCMKAGVVPREIAPLDALDTIGSTGSPLSPEGYGWLYSHVKRDLWLASSSGGTDIVGAFLGGVPTLPVRIGEMQCRTLGSAIEVYDDTGQPVIGAVGELVCTKPMPSMPLYFWGDTGHARYLESYFDTFTRPDGKPVWRHGDWLQLTPREQAVAGVIYGRSDATINRQGIRMGTSELYRAVDQCAEVVDSMVVDLEYLGRESHMVLFVVLRAGQTLDPGLDTRLRGLIRTALSARHVPNEIVQVAQIPKTLTGKKLELPVKKLMLGHALDKVVKRDAMANPESIDWYLGFAAQYLARPKS